MSACQCGSTEFEPAAHEAYSVCRGCGSATLTQLLTDGPAAMRDRLEELYGESYWTTHQTAHSMPVIEERARLDLGERCSYWLGQLLRYLPAPAAVLEVGCGHGGLLKMLQLCGYVATGTEISDDVAAFGRRQFGVDVAAGFFEDHAGSLGSYDGVLLLDVLEHFVSPEDAIGHVAQHLRPDGVVVIQTPCHRPDLPSEWPMYFPPEHTVLLSRKALGSLLARHGLTNVEFAPALFDYDMFAFASRRRLAATSAAASHQRLAQTPDGRVILALLDTAATVLQLRRHTGALEAEAAALSTRSAAFEGYAGALWRSRWVQVGRFLGLTRTAPPGAT